MAQIERMKKVALCLLGAVLLAGCATPEQIRARKAKFYEFQGSKPVCSSEETCKRAWSAAQVWVAQNCGLKIQLATDTIIETYGSRRESSALQCRVLKEPMPRATPGYYIISFDAGCGGYAGCSVDPLDAGINFNQYVSAAAGT